MYAREHSEGGIKEFTVKEGTKWLESYRFAHDVNLERIELPQ